MADSNLLRPIPNISRGWLATAAVLALGIIGSGYWWVVAAVGLLVIGWAIATYRRRRRLDQPWPWPSDFQMAVENLARSINPTPPRILPEDPKAADCAKVVTTKEDLDRLLADKQSLWPWAVLTSVLVQRRNAVLPRLRDCASGYQPRPGKQVTGSEFSGIARQTMDDIVEQLTQLQGFMLSPAFTGFLADTSDGRDIEPSAVLQIADRFMDSHENLLNLAERCLQTRVQPELTVFVQDLSAGALCPLIGYDNFINRMCQMVAEGRDSLPYVDGHNIDLGEANLVIGMPDGLSARIRAQISRHAGLSN